MKYTKTSAWTGNQCKCSTGRPNCDTFSSEAMFSCYRLLLMGAVDSITVSHLTALNWACTSGQYWKNWELINIHSQRIRWALAAVNVFDSAPIPGAWGTLMTKAGCCIITDNERTSWHAAEDKLIFFKYVCKFPMKLKWETHYKQTRHVLTSRPWFGTVFPF